MARKIISEQYSKMAQFWKGFEPPARPSLRELLFCDEKIKKLCVKNKQKKALILGATPELRDLLHMNGVETVLLDANKAMPKAMNELRYYKQVREKLIFGNWLNMKTLLGLEKFDIVIGDFPQDNIRFKDWPRLWSGVHAVLKKDGIFLVSVWNLASPKHASCQNLFKNYQKNPREFEYFYHRTSSLLPLFNEAGAYDPHTHELNFQKAYEYLSQKAHAYNLSQKKFRRLWFFPDKKTIEDMKTIFMVTPPLRTTIQSLEKAGLKLVERFADTSATHMEIKEYVCLKKLKIPITHD